MALFNYFPNYVWNLSVAIALESGAQIGEIMDMCQPLLERAEGGEDAGTADFMQSWIKEADKLAGLAKEDEEAGHLFSAADKQKRAALYYLVGERMQGHGHPGRAETYRKGVDAFMSSIENAKENCERVEFPYQGKTLSGYFTRAEGVTGPAPCVLYLNGLDSNKEMLYWSQLPHELARRGISCLCLDQPGTGESLRLNGFPADPISENWGTPAYEYLASRDDVDAERIGITGISLGGYYAPRVCANEPRFASGACWGANHNWAEVQHKRLKREGENPVPHYWNHVQWVFGADDMESFFKKADLMCLDGEMEKIRVPFLVTHGIGDRQISVDYAHTAYDQLINSPKRALKLFTEREGGVEHVGADNMSFGRHYIADWFADTLGGHAKP
ncbi:alpha/beta fold hydrolase [Breoghania sp.]|uniref:alpha/beta hydrolase family protein n=1 Tax=Breoghania sp. TaxID=2065378 RepID=UPI002AAB2794|nr:alpha/beta fold hydrolase [Breoghania sp.]